MITICLYAKRPGSFFDFDSATFSSLVPRVWSSLTRMCTEFRDQHMPYAERSWRDYLSEWELLKFAETTDAPYHAMVSALLVTSQISLDYLAGQLKLHWNGGMEAFHSAIKVPDIQALHADRSKLLLRHALHAVKHDTDECTNVLATLFHTEVADESWKSIAQAQESLPAA